MKRHLPQLDLDFHVRQSSSISGEPSSGILILPDGGVDHFEEELGAEEQA